MHRGAERPEQVHHRHFAAEPVAIRIDVRGGQMRRPGEGRSWRLMGGWNSMWNDLIRT